MKKALAILLVASMALCSVFANGAAESGSTEIYFLNFKPEVADVYTNVVKPAFEAENPGYTLKVVTAASNQYETTLRSEITKSNPPVIFQVNGPVGLVNWGADAAALDDTDFYALLADKSMALTYDGHVAAVPYAVEGYGIIYNDAIMQKYFAMDGAVVSSVDEIKSFDTLKAVVEDMQSKKDALGIQGVFASTSMSAGNDWRWQTHLFNLPLYQEMADKAGAASATLAANQAATFDFAYNEEFKQIWDLYLNNSTCAPSMVGSKSVSDSMAEFALGQCAMVQNGNWGANEILNYAGNTVASEDIKFMPIYIGLPGEESQGLCIGTENYLCFNASASDAAIEGADVFLTWLYGSETGMTIVKNDLKFLTPFSSFTSEYVADDPLAQQVNAWMNDSSVTAVPWSFSGIPSEAWKASFGGALLEYINGNMSWDQVVETATTQWAAEAKLAGRE